MDTKSPPRARGAPRLFLAAILALGWLGAASAADPIRLGVAGPYTGDLAFYGIPSRSAAELVVKAVNARGGVLGRTVELVVEDDLCKPEIAADVAAKLVAIPVDAVLGHICSEATAAALGAYRSAAIIAVSPSATSPALTRGGEHPNFYRTIATHDSQARLAVDFMVTRLKAKKIALINGKDDRGKDFADSAKELIEESGRAAVVLFEGVGPGTSDWSALLRKVKQKGADTLVCGGDHPEASKLVTQLRKKKMKTHFVAYDSAMSDAFLKAAGEHAEGVYASGPRELSNRPLALRANEEHRSAYGTDPGAFYLNAYAAALALLNAIEKAGSTEQPALEKALRSEWVETPVGRIRFDQRGEAIGVGFSMYQVKKGGYVEVQQ